jgi:hypothetical protein
MDPQIRRRRTLGAIKRIVLRESLEHALVVIFEDLHWIDSETQALLDLIADSGAGARLLLLVNYRPEYRQRAGALPLQTQISLAAVLSDFGAADEFKKLLASIAKWISTWQLGFAIIALFASACATPVGVTRLDEQAAHRELTANVLSTGKPSEYSTQLLERKALSERFDQDPQSVLAELNSGLGRTDERDQLFALSELSFAYAEESRNGSYYWHPQFMRMPSFFRQIRRCPESC